MEILGHGERGIYYPESKRIVIYLDRHECFEDILSTIQHELIHAAIEDQNLDEDQEEKLIYALSWANYHI
tara:strand:+ start:258 stop:467 length:210 start_codon:yes stop_codon:yes gene_type:complete